ncbi:MAG: hypothetical protein Q9196_006891, partial [Gyalolechia fulgens]
MMTRFGNSKSVGLTKQDNSTTIPGTGPPRHPDLRPGLIKTQQSQHPTTVGLQRRKKHAKNTLSEAEVESHARSFIQFISDNPTVFHAVQELSGNLQSHGFIKLSARDPWSDKIKRGGKYFVERNGSAIIAFAVGNNYNPGNGVAVIASH